MRTRVHEHLRTSRQAMPKKASWLWLGEKGDARYRRSVRQQRRLIAEYYRRVRADPSHGPAIARVAHRHGVVTTAVGAKSRLQHLPPRNAQQRS